MESIKKWFDGNCPYPEGVALYAVLPTCMPNLLKRFKSGNDAARLEKLKYELRKAAGSAWPSATVVIKATEPKVPAIISDPKRSVIPDVRATPLFHQLPQELRPVLLVAGNLFKENCMLKTELNDLAPEMESEAFDIQIRIFNNIKKNALCWQKIDHWQEHKTIFKAAPSKAAQLTAPQLVKRQAQLFSSISKLKKRLHANREALPLETTTKGITQRQRIIAKQAANLMAQETQLLEITHLIDPKHE